MVNPIDRPVPGQIDRLQNQQAVQDAQQREQEQASNARSVEQQQTQEIEVQDDVAVEADQSESEFIQDEDRGANLDTFV